MWNLKQGDIIECINVGSNKGITVGREYKVEAVEPDPISITDDSGASGRAYYSERFKLVRRKGESEDMKFKVGSIVECVDGDIANGIMTGRKYEILNIKGGLVEIINDYGDRYKYSKNGFKLITGGKNMSTLKKTAKAVKPIMKNYLMVRGVELLLAAAFPKLNTKGLEKAIRVIAEKGFGVIFSAIAVVGVEAIDMLSDVANKVIDAINSDDDNPQ